MGLAPIINDHPVFFAFRPLYDPQAGLALVFEFD
jgi:hypothetical protein